MAARKKRPVDKDELLAAARLLRGRLDAYIDKGFRDGVIAQGLEPLLRHYAREYVPRLNEQRESIDYKLASAAWQILLRNPKRADLQRMLRNTAKLRCEHNREDTWPPDERAAMLAIEEILRPEKKPGRAPTDIARANRILEVIGEGYVGIDSRRGVRAERRKLLQAAEVTARMIVNGIVEMEFVPT